MLSSKHSKVITVQEGIPSSLWLTLDGPTLAAECQQVIFSANAVGGVPPYRYQWSMGDDYCPSETCPSDCSASPNFEGQATQIAKYNPGFGASTNNVCVTVTDALGASAPPECVSLRVKPMLFPLEIVVRGTSTCSNNAMFPVNSDIIFLPDINPLSAFEYPTNYHWDFDDGTTYLDNVDGGGFAMHRYVLESGGSYPQGKRIKIEYALREVKNWWKISILVVYTTSERPHIFGEGPDVPGLKTAPRRTTRGRARFLQKDHF